MDSPSVGRQAAVFAALCVLVLVVPAAWRVALYAWGPGSSAPPSYLPSLESARPRAAFVSEPIGDLQRLAPGYVVIGDSMAGRVDVDTLTRLSSQAIAPILENATGSAYWYLVLKNYVVASGIRPKAVFIFFRDTNLTDPMFRMTGPYREMLDHVARASEPELDAVVASRTQGAWYRVHRVVDETYGVDRAREWLLPAVANWPARVVAGGAGGAALTARLNDAFSLEHLRPIPQADLDAADDRDANFDATVGPSVLPRMLSLARSRQLRVVFVRVLRRPVDDQPPPESPALREYVAKLGAYIRAEGGVLLDDRDDPSLARLPYADGDHVARESCVPYTERLWARLPADLR